MKTLFAIAFAAITIPSIEAASVIVNWSTASDPTRLLLDHNGDPLSAGTSASGDGTLLQLGYHDMATTATPFAGSWVVLATTSMGDDGVDVAGKFSTTSILNSGSFTQPAIGTPLAIRFYDGTSVGSSTYFNAVSVTNGAWNFKSPSDPAAVLNLVIDKGSSTVFEGGLLGDFSTIRPIPEPSHVILVVIGGVISLSRRRRK